eukprot:TRINITY_DN13257_c0_g1_i2.p1 TRINITY_DN13257_c0_g1~~TRINITY_DN13257_c0_g1_i2.p1  ORF type:complete len:283 (+),score=54.79 TRINITY_DN13257_c0_g1_i2:51-851(+)
MADVLGELQVGSKVKFVGEAINCKHVRLHGSIRGFVEGKRLGLGTGGVFSGDAVFQSAHVAGTLRGSLECLGRLTMRTGGRVSGDVMFGDLATEPGSYVDGRMLCAVEKPVGAVPRKLWVAPRPVMLRPQRSTRKFANTPSPVRSDAHSTHAAAAAGTAVAAAVAAHPKAAYNKENSPASAMTVRPKAQQEPSAAEAASSSAGERAGPAPSSTTPRGLPSGKALAAAVLGLGNGKSDSGSAKASAEPRERRRTAPAAAGPHCRSGG